MIYVIEGTGYSIVDGERVDWEEGDLFLLPIKPNGIEHKHFNTDPTKGCRWIGWGRVAVPCRVDGATLAHR